MNDDPKCPPEGLDIVRRLRSIARAITYSSDAAENRHEWEAADEITRLRSEVARLTAERDKALTVAVVLNETDTRADRHARDIAVVEAALEAAMDAVSDNGCDNVGAIYYLDPEAVLKAMEEGR
jgi:hypothetical protein